MKYFDGQIKDSGGYLTIIPRARGLQSARVQQTRVE